MGTWLSLVPLLLVGWVAGNGGGVAPPMKQRVDMIELNHLVDDDGREVFRQVIFYEWSKANRQFHVRAWRMIKRESQVPERRWNPKGYQCTWQEDGLLRQVWAPQMRETWTQQDPERVNRKILSEDRRLPLFAPKIAEATQSR